MVGLRSFETMNHLGYFFSSWSVHVHEYVFWKVVYQNFFQIRVSIIYYYLSQLFDVFGDLFHLKFLPSSHFLTQNTQVTELFIHILSYDLGSFFM